MMGNIEHNGLRLDKLHGRLNARLDTGIFKIVLSHSRWSIQTTCKIIPRLL